MNDHRSVHFFSTEESLVMQVKRHQKLTSRMPYLRLLN